MKRLLPLIWLASWRWFTHGGVEKHRRISGEAIIASGELTTVASIEEMDRERFFMILEKRGS